MAEEVGVPILETAEKLRVTEQEIRADIYEGVVDWVKTDCISQFKDIYPGKGLNRDIAMANHAKNLAQALFIISKADDPTRAKYENELVKALTDRTNPKSLVNSCGIKNQYDVESFMIGVVSVLTALHLIEQKWPGIFDDANISQVITKPEMDVRDKIDLQIVFKGKQRGKINLIQLKSANYPCVRIEEITEPKEYFGDISKSDSEKILQRRQQLENINPQDDVRAYAMIVPNISQRSVGNIFGKLKHNHEGDEISRLFGVYANNVGFYPGVKKSEI